jgi:hypothetical protein
VLNKTDKEDDLGVLFCDKMTGTARLLVAVARPTALADLAGLTAKRMILPCGGCMDAEEAAADEADEAGDGDCRGRWG